MAGKEHTIFKSYLFWTLDEEKEQKECIKEMIIEDAEYFGEEVDLSDERIDERFWDELDMFYNDEKSNMSQKLPNNIIAIADVGRWDGRKNGYKLMGDNLNEVLYFGDCDDIHVYCDRYDIHSIMAHHDGRHYVTYRMIKEGVDEDRVIDKILKGEDVSRYTTSLRPFVKQIYGWK